MENNYGDENTLNALLSNKEQTNNSGTEESLGSLIDTQQPTEDLSIGKIDTTVAPLPLMDKVKAYGQAAYAGSLNFLSQLASQGTKLVGTPDSEYKKMKNPDLMRKIDQGLGLDQSKALDDIKQNYLEAKNTYQGNLGEDRLSSMGLKLANLGGNVASGLALPMVPGAGAGASLLSRLGSNAASGTAYGGLFGGSQYNPETNGEFDLKGAATGAALGGVLGAGTGALGTWMDRTKALGQAKEAGYGATVFNRDVKGGGLKEFWDKNIGGLPLVGDKTDRLAQEASFVPAVGNFIKSLSNKVSHNDDMYTLSKSVGNVVQGASQRMSDQESTLWNKVTANGDFKVSADALNGVKKQATDLIDKYGTKYLGESNYKVNQLLNLKPEDATFNTLQKIKSQLGATEQRLWKSENTGNIDRDVVMEFKGLVRSLKDTLGDAAMTKGKDVSSAYLAANEFSKNKNRLFDEGGRQLESAIKDNAMAYNFMNKLITEKNPLQVERMTKMFSPEELNTLKASTIAKHFNDSITKIDYPNGVSWKNNGPFLAGGTQKLYNANNGFGVDDLHLARQNGIDVSAERSVAAIDVKKFVNNIKKDTNLATLMGGKDYRALEGLTKIMEDNVASQASRKSAGSAVRNIAAAGALTGAAATIGSTGALALAASIKSLTKISASSPLKNALIKAGEAAPNSAVYKYIMNRLPEHFRNAGIRVGMSAKGAELTDE